MVSDDVYMDGVCPAHVVTALHHRVETVALSWNQKRHLMEGEGERERVRVMCWKLQMGVRKRERGRQCTWINFLLM